MPAPSASIMYGFWRASYTQQQTPYVDEYTLKLFAEIERAWILWQNGITFGGLTVTGAGIGGWSGIGTGGTASENTKFKISPFPFYQTTEQHRKFILGLSYALEKKFSEWAKNFTLSTVQYVGGSTASPTSPGNFTASVSPMPVGTLVTNNVDGIAELWKEKLTVPDFNIDHPQARTKEMVAAVSGAIEKSFKTLWALSTTINGSTASGLASVGVGAGNGTSQKDGKLL